MKINIHIYIYIYIYALYVIKQKSLLPGLLQGLAASDWPHMCAIVDAGRQKLGSMRAQALRFGFVV